MKQLLFITTIDTSGDLKFYDGPTKKQYQQIRVFQEFGYQVSYTYFEGDSCMLYIDGKALRICKRKDKYHKTMNFFYKKLIKVLKDRPFDIIYIRYAMTSLTMLKFLKAEKSFNREMHIIGELPTYMGKWDARTSFIGKIRFIAKRIIDKFMPLPIERMVTFDNQDIIFGYKTIQIDNFTDVKEISPKNRTNNINNELNLVAVAGINPSHGFDRVIKGLADYYSTNPSLKVNFYIVGKGAYEEELKNLTMSLNLSQYIHFEGAKWGQDLDKIYELADIAVASLAIFRKKCKKSSDLKVREYLSRGIPFIYSSEEPTIDGQPFCFRVPHNESNIDIFSIIEFGKNAVNDKTSRLARVFAEKYCTPQFQMGKIFEVIQ